MKHIYYTCLFTILMSMVEAKVSAHNIAVENSDGKYIYYEWNSNKTELSVTFQGSFYDSYSNEYSGNVVIPDRVEYNGSSYPVTSISYRTFEDCSGLTSVTIPSSVTSIGFYAFYGCSGLASVNIPSGVTSIGFYAFAGCSSLTSIIIPSSVTSIGSSPFAGCSGLKKVTWNAKAYLNFSYNDPFTDIKTIITDFVIGEDMTTVPASICCGMRNLTSVTIPNTVTSIESYAFDGCSSLTSVIIPSSVTSIGSSAFAGCSNLTNVTIPNSITNIENSAFRGCSGLKQVIVPDFDTAKWCNISFGSHPDPNTFGGNDANPLIYAHHLYSDENTEIKNLVIPSGVTNINDYAFFGCSGLKNVTIPNSVTSIGHGAFWGCSGLDTITMSSSVTSIGGYAFEDCSELKQVIVPDFDVVKWCNISFCNYAANPLFFAHHLYSNKNTKITKMVIPSSVTSIGNYAFVGYSSLTSVTIPSSVTSIGSSAFNGCSGLTSVTIPESVTSIGSSAFDGCTGLTSMIIPNSVTNIGNSAFNSCSGLTSVTIPEGVKSIGNYAFWSSGLKTLIIKGGKDEELQIGNRAFSSCPLDSVYIGRNITYSTTSSAGYSPFYRNTTLRTVHITSKETEISENEFYGCTNLQNITIGDGVKTIGSYAFSGCSSLEYFACGTQVDSIGKEAFSDCTAMTTFKSKAMTPPTCGSQALDDINKWECTLHVPRPSIGAYQGAEQWKEFFFVEAMPLEKGDVNGDYAITMADANAVVNYFLATEKPEDFDVETADVNGDGSITMADANQIVNMFLGGK